MEKITLKGNKREKLIKTKAEINELGFFLKATLEDQQEIQKLDLGKNKQTKEQKLDKPLDNLNQEKLLEHS